MTFEEAFHLADSVVFATIKRHLKDVEVAILRGACHGQKYQEIASRYGCTAEYLKHDVGPKLWKLLSEALGERVSKKNFRAALERRWHGFHLERKSDAIEPTEKLLPLPDSRGETESRRSPNSNLAVGEKVATPKYQDWGEAIDPSPFYGRAAELSQLQQWIATDRSPVVALSGEVGIGKTALAVTCAQQLQSEFDFIIWRSLLSAPAIEEILADLLPSLAAGEEIDLPKSRDSQISLLLHYLASARCLLVLDNVEAILEDRDRSTGYRVGCESYKELLQAASRSNHQSCLLLIGRELPPEMASSICSLPLTGLEEMAGKELLKSKGFTGSEEVCRKIVDRYQGNPLALKPIGKIIQEISQTNGNRDISHLWHQCTAVFAEIDELLDHQFACLSALEKQVMYCLADRRSPIYPADLLPQMMTPISEAKLIEVLNSLWERSLVEKNAARFTQQPAIGDYMTKRFQTQ
jgi:hypothetical protein